MITCAEKTKWLGDFVTEVVDGWMIKDLKRLRRIKHRPSKPGNCNFPIALYTFSCIEFLGQLTTPSPLPSSGYTQTSIMGFIDDFFPDDFKQKLQPYSTNFVNIFRNGLAHNYFAKAAGISRTEVEPIWTEKGHIVLDADRFAEAFCLAITRLKESIKNDSLLVERMVDNYEAQYQSHLKFKPPLTMTYTTRSSGASLAHPSMLQGIISSTAPQPPTLIKLSKTTTTLPPLPSSNKKP